MLALLLLAFLVVVSMALGATIGSAISVEAIEAEDEAAIFALTASIFAFMLVGWLLNNVRQALMFRTTYGNAALDDLELHSDVSAGRSCGWR